MVGIVGPQARPIVRRPGLGRREPRLVRPQAPVGLHAEIAADRGNAVTKGHLQKPVERVPLGQGLVRAIQREHRHIDIADLPVDRRMDRLAHLVALGTRRELGRGRERTAALWRRRCIRRPHPAGRVARRKLSIAHRNNVGIQPQDERRGQSHRARHIGEGPAGLVPRLGMIGRAEARSAISSAIAIPTSANRSSMPRNRSARATAPARRGSGESEVGFSKDTDGVYCITQCASSSSCPLQFRDRRPPCASGTAVLTLCGGSHTATTLPASIPNGAALSGYGERQRNVRSRP